MDVRKQVKPTLPERFWAKVVMAEGCWLWIAGKSSRGYGVLGDGAGGSIQAHRASWEINFGPIPKGMCVCHRCDVPACVRPSHLFLGTQSENVADMIAKGRRRGGAPTGERNGSAKLTEAMVRDIREASGTQQAIAERYGVSQFTVSEIKRGKTWRHVRPAANLWTLEGSAE